MPEDDTTPQPSRFSRAMGRLLNINGAPAVPPWQGTVPLTSNVILQALGLWETPGNPGQVRTPEEAIGIAAVARATQVLTGAVASAPRTVVADETGEEDEALEDIISSPLMNTFTLWEQFMLRLLYEGNFYAIKNNFKPISGGFDGIVPVPGEFVKPHMVIDDVTGAWKDTVYVVTFPGHEPVGISPEEMFHIPGLGFDGLQGLSVLEYAATTLGTAKASTEFAAKFYGSGSMLSGVLTTDKRLDEKSATGLKERWRQKVQGINNAFDIVVLDSATKFQPVSISPKDAQWIEARQFDVKEIARVFGVHPQLLMETEMGQAGDPEQKSTDFVTFTLNFWTARICAAVDEQLLPKGKCLRIFTQKLVQPDLRVRSSAAVMWRKAQVKSINEIRIEEGLPKIDDPRADDPFYVEVTATETGPAAEPGTNQGNPEQPVPDEQKVAPETPPTEQNQG